MASRNPSVEITDDLESSALTPALLPRMREFQRLVADNVASNAVFGMQRRESEEQLSEIARKCSQPNWDGYGAAIISAAARADAWQIIEGLPEQCDTPDVSPEPRGSISLEWENDDGLSLVISLDGSRRLAYYADLGDGCDRRGTERLQPNLPAHLEDLLARFSVGRDRG